MSLERCWGNKTSKKSPQRNPPQHTFISQHAKVYDSRASCLSFASWFIKKTPDLQNNSKKTANKPPKHLLNKIINSFPSPGYHPKDPPQSLTQLNQTPKKAISPSPVIHRSFRFRTPRWCSSKTHPWLSAAWSRAWSNCRRSSSSRWGWAEVVI